MPTVLLVDDNEGITDLVTALLADEFAMITAGTGEAAIDIIDSDLKIDAVLLDLGLPDMDGWCVNQVIQAGRPGLPVIVFSVRAEPENALRAAVEGASYYVTKPFSIEALLDVVTRATSPKAATFVSCDGCGGVGLVG